MEEEEENKEEFWGYEDLEDCEYDSSVPLSPPDYISNRSSSDHSSLDHLKLVVKT